ncbi:LytR C-terminal domain-containing protein [Candidatus Uhrbacteria bacterium]|nr:LytR C-terminal domain-containing protein [Candidatus Uhrbacteria bacterium]
MIKRTSASRTKKVVMEEPMVSTTTTPPKGTGTSRAIPIVIALVLVVGGVGYFVNAAMKGKTSADVTQGQIGEGVNAEEVNKTIERVRSLTVTTADEFPTVATIQNISILRPQNPTLYRDAENGDKLLVWSDKVVVYSANKDRLLVVMPINIPPTVSAPVAAATVTEEPTVTLEVRNGSATLGVARVLSEKLKGEGFKTLAPGDAKNKLYASTVIYNATGKTIPNTLEKLVASTGGTVVDSLEGERESKADLLIIVGGK